MDRKKRKIKTDAWRPHYPEFSSATNSTVCVLWASGRREVIRVIRGASRSSWLCFFIRRMSPFAHNDATTSQPYQHFPSNPNKYYGVNLYILFSFSTRWAVSFRALMLSCWQYRCTSPLDLCCRCEGVSMRLKRKLIALFYISIQCSDCLNHERYFLDLALRNEVSFCIKCFLKPTYHKTLSDNVYEFTF